MEFQTSLQDSLSKTTSKTEILSQDSTDPVDFYSTYIFTCQEPNCSQFQDFICWEVCSHSDHSKVRKLNLIQLLAHNFDSANTCKFLLKIESI